ncbi:MAG: hypothetical protein A2Y17_05315 [Clostridiales bacterium GWF2_38_85]|nr:MAG: hypothetical protein A2Y17_05315 [Clostridiales bacterium GWF2_38_85]
MSLAVTIFAIAAFLLSFEHKKNSSRELTVIAVMTALSVVGRMIFALLPGFKPVTAIVVITAMYFGVEAGFLTGALSAVISNLTFGQGAWTPFQMLSWGIIGLLAGFLSPILKKSKIMLSVYAVISGILFSFIMDFWSVLWIDNNINWARLGAFAVTALPVTIEYAVSNVIFLLLLAKPIGKKLDRVKIKFGLFKKELPKIEKQ